MSAASIVCVGPCEVSANPLRTRAKTLPSQRDFKRTLLITASCKLDSLGRPVTYTRGPLDCNATGLRRPGDYRRSLTTSALSISFLSALLRSLQRVSLFVVFFGPVDDHGSPVIFRSVSVRPTHLFDPSFRP